MSIRSRYTGVRREPRQSTDRSVPKSPKGEGITTKAKNAIKRFAGYVEKNQRDYQRSTGDKSSLSDDLIMIPIRVIRETGKMGREEVARIERMKRKDSDEEICRFASGRGQKKPAQCDTDRKKFVVKTPKPKPKPRSRQREVYLEYDPEAEVEY